MRIEEFALPEAPIPVPGKIEEFVDPDRIGVYCWTDRATSSGQVSLRLIVRRDSLGGRKYMTSLIYKDDADYRAHWPVAREQLTKAARLTVAGYDDPAWIAAREREQKERIQE